MMLSHFYLFPGIHIVILESSLICFEISDISGVHVFKMTRGYGLKTQ